MLRDVRERFLNEAVDRALELGVETTVAVLGARGAEIDPRVHFEPHQARAALAQGLDGRSEPELVESRRTELRDQAAKRADLLRDLVHCRGDDLLEPFRRARPKRRREGD